VAGGHCAEPLGLHGRHSTASDASRRGAAVGQNGRADQAVGILAGATRNGGRRFMRAMGRGDVRLSNEQRAVFN
jgi:hypothetical protein